MQQASGCALVQIGGSDPDVAPPSAPNRSSSSDVLMRKHDEQVDVRMLLERGLGCSLGIVVLENRLGVHDLDLAYLLHFGIIQPLLEAGLPRDAEPRWMGLHQPDRLDLLEALGMKELGNRRDELRKLSNIVSHAHAS